MVGVVLLGLLLAAPPPPMPVAPNVDRGQANSFAHTVHTLAAHIKEQYTRSVELKDMVEAAIRGMYEEAGVTLPDEVRSAVRRADNQGDQLSLLADARLVLAKSPAMEGTIVLRSSSSVSESSSTPGISSPKWTAA